MREYVKTQIIVKLDANWVKLQEDSEPPMCVFAKAFARENPGLVLVKQTKLNCVFEAPYGSCDQAILEERIIETLQNALDIEPDEEIAKWRFRNFREPLPDGLDIPPHMWRVNIGLDIDWVLAHRNDPVLPIDDLLIRLGKSFEHLTIQLEELTSCSVIVNVDAEQEIIEKLEAILADMGATEEVTLQEITLLSQARSQPITIALPPAVQMADKPLPSTEQINKLIGAEDFRQLCEDVVGIAPQLLRHETVGSFVHQCYLFSIEDGCGLSTQLCLFSELLEVLKLFTAGCKRLELAADLRLENIIEQVEHCGLGSWLICIDISQWMDKIRHPEFRTLLRKLYALRADKIFVFRIPFVDTETRRKVYTVIGDVFSLRTVVTNPYSMEDLIRYAKQLLLKKSFRMTDDGWLLFEQWIIHEKTGRYFYGMNTIEKMVDGLFYQKHLRVAQNKHFFHETQIGTDDFPNFERHSMDERPAMEQLNELIGIEKIRKRIEEVLAQVQVATKNDSMKPCLHMRFVGAPGTGKTTVARILGKLFKEQEILSKGLFFEYEGRDFCGQYIGETAPKTAAICRDAYGSLLFIDEAYSLYRGDKDNRDYGKEAIDTLVAQMENHRHDLVVIMAGYTEDMKILMKGNIGLSSRMPYIIEFPNYGRDDLFLIFMQMVTKAFPTEHALETAAKNYFNAMDNSVLQSKQFANARFVRNIFERTWAKASVRQQINPEEKFRLCACDFESAVADKEFDELQEKNTKHIGF